jgi:hypothetical protein
MLQPSTALSTASHNHSTGYRQVSEMDVLRTPHGATISPQWINSTIDMTKFQGLSSNLPEAFHFQTTTPQVLEEARDDEDHDGRGGNSRYTRFIIQPQQHLLREVFRSGSIPASRRGNAIEISDDDESSTSSFDTFEWPPPAIANVDIIPAVENDDDSMEFPFVTDDDDDDDSENGVEETAFGKTFVPLLEEASEDDYEELIPADRGVNVHESSTSPFDTVERPTPAMIGNVDLITEDVSWCSFATDDDDGDSENEFEVTVFGKTFVPLVEEASEDDLEEKDYLDTLTFDEIHKQLEDVALFAFDQEASGDDEGGED